MTRVSGEAARFLAARREDLNRRFERARKRWPKLDGEGVLGLVAQIVAPLAGPEPGADDLCAAVFDLVLLHAGRETFASPALSHLLRVSMPALRPLLLARPGSLPAALSNAVENVGARGADLSTMLATLGPKVGSAEQLADLAVVGAWRLGEARLRGAALRSATRIPAPVALSALDLGGWPEHALPAVVGALQADAWTHPREALSVRTLDRVRSPEDGLALAKAVTTRPREPAATLALVAHVGDFVGFGGRFARPPRVLDGGDPHTLYARVVDDPSCDWRLDADVFGAAASRIEPSGLLARTLDTKARRQLAEAVPVLEGSTSFAILGDVVATTRADSHRIRIHAPRPVPL